MAIIRSNRGKKKSKALCIAFLLLATCVIYLVFNNDNISTEFSSSLTNSVLLDLENTNSDADFSLANEQSFGFFTDISNSNWKLKQQVHANMFPNHFHPKLSQFSNRLHHQGVIEKLKNSRFWYGQNFHEEFHCPIPVRVPSTGEADGPKWVCDPHRIAAQDSCLVYSIGSNGNADFERGVKEVIGEHCEIHTFDFVTYNKRNGHFEAALEGYSTFHSWGLGTQEEADAFLQTGRGNNVKTLKQTIAELGHTGRTIDIFKIDCEWCEWHTYKDWIEADVTLRQILVETHNAPMPNAQDFFFDLHDNGYVIFSKEANFPNGGGGVEYAFLKLSTSFFINNSMYKYSKKK